MAHRVTLISGDGIGPEVTRAARAVLERSGVQFEPTAGNAPDTADPSVGTLAVAEAILGAMDAAR